MKKNNKLNNKYELFIESIGFEGIAIARKDGIVHFVKGAVPGDKVLVNEKRKRKNYIEDYLLEIIEESKDRVIPLCKHFGICGGCSWQNLSYEKQLFWKKQHVIDSFFRIGKIKEANILNTLSAPTIYNYRNKMEFSFGASRWVTPEEIIDDTNITNKDFALGLHISGRFDKVLDIDYCYIQNDICNQVLFEIKQKAIEFSASAFNQLTHIGFLRNVVFRYSVSNKELLLILVTNKIIDESDKTFINWFYNIFPTIYPQVQNILHAINDKITPIAFGEYTIIKGNDFIYEKIHDINYRISPFSFFQTNSYQLERFLNKIIELSDIKNNEIVWDLYCGTGSITLQAANYCKKIYGIELVESSINDAKLNANINNIKNAIFHVHDLHSKNITDILLNYPKPELILIDPPRAGMHPILLNYLYELEPDRIVYISCNPTTQARDCELLSNKYDIIKIQPVDMFPHTFHIESIASLKRKY